MPTIVPSQFSAFPKWPAGLEPTPKEAPILMAAWTHFFSGVGPDPQMPQGWHGGSSRWNDQIALIQKSAQDARQHVPGGAGRADAPGGTPTSSSRPAADDASADEPAASPNGKPAAGGKGALIAVVVALVGVGGLAAWKLWPRSKAAAPAVQGRRPRTLV